MIASAHLAIGAAGGIFVQKYIPLKYDYKVRLLAASSIGVFSHILLDAVPHQEYFNEWPWPLLIIEMISVCLFVIVPRLKGIANLVIFSGMFGGAIPDVLDRVSGATAQLMHHVLHVTHAILPLGFEVPVLIQLTITTMAIIYVRFKTA